MSVTGSQIRLTQAQYEDVAKRQAAQDQAVRACIEALPVVTDFYWEQKADDWILSCTVSTEDEVPTAVERHRISEYS